MVRQHSDRLEVDWDRLAQTVRLAVRFLDDVVEVNRYPLPQIKRLAKGNRKIGLGVMGFAHLLILLGIPYDSDESVNFASSLMQFIQMHSHDASQELARTRGSFPNFPGSIYDAQGKAPMRNATVTTIAPTGSLSLIAGCSSGIEPLFALYYTRIIPGNIGVAETDPLFQHMGEQEGILEPGLVSELKKTGFLPEDSRIPRKLKALFATATKIPPARHVAIQAAFQAHTDNAVSKTINFSSQVSLDEIKKTLLLAHEMKCKGVTIYRDRSRACQTLTCGVTSIC
jgi:ribonucleoside-diphosphate reductase alpha chain